MSRRAYIHAAGGKHHARSGLFLRKRRLSLGLAHASPSHAKPWGREHLEVECLTRLPGTGFLSRVPESKRGRYASLHGAVPGRLTGGSGGLSREQLKSSTRNTSHLCVQRPLWIWSVARGLSSCARAVMGTLRTPDTVPGRPTDRRKSNHLGSTGLTTVGASEEGTWCEGTRKSIRYPPFPISPLFTMTESRAPQPHWSGISNWPGMQLAVHKTNATLPSGVVDYCSRHRDARYVCGRTSLLSNNTTHGDGKACGRRGQDVNLFTHASGSTPWM